MKKTALFYLFLAFFQAGQAQPLDEWLQQKKTGIRYLTEQIAGLKAYTGVVQKGFSVAQTGLTTLARIKGGDRQLHQDHFTSLRTVSPAVLNYWKLPASKAAGKDLLNAVVQSRRLVQATLLLSSREKAVARSVLDQLSQHIYGTLEQLLAVVTNDRTTLRDAERIGKLDAFYSELTALKAAIGDYRSSLQLLVWQRKGERYKEPVMQRLYK
ncbi:MAG: hypothetical protein JWP69_1648 [Flaviaesturariibacter sp.]|nr:hypothetical protein [Flaviaesturariibacter sp.]